MEIQDRLKVFFDRLEKSENCSTAVAALALVSRLIEEVEDEWCPIPREDPPPMRFTGRMYAPQPNRVETRTNGSLVASTRHHRIYCFADSGIRIEHVPTHRTIFQKSGRP